MIHHPEDFIIVSPNFIDYNQEIIICDMLVLLFQDPMFCHKKKPNWQKDFHYTECEYPAMN
jgi:hypothetical protein